MCVCMFVCVSERLQKQLVTEVASSVRELGPGVAERLTAMFYNFFNVKM